MPLYMSGGVHRGQKRILHTLELELDVLVTCPTLALAAELRYSARTAADRLIC